MDFDTEARGTFEVLGIGDNLRKPRDVDDVPDLRIPTKSPGYNGILAPGIPE